MHLKSNRPPSPPRRVTSPVSAAAVPRRFSRLLVSNCDYPERPKVIVLIVGGPSATCDALLKHWEGEAHEEEFNFCAIEAGDAAEADGYLTNMLCSHVPLDTCIYIVQSDTDVPGEELKRVQDLLNQLQISVATIQPLLANEYDHWFAPSVELQDPAEAGLANSGPVHGDQIRMPMPSSIAEAFDQLQFTSHWQAATSTHGAKVLCELLDRISIEKAVQRQGQSALEAVLAAMTHDQAMLESVLSVAAQLPADSESLVAISRMYLAYMEHRVASGNLDDKPLVALDHARCVHRYKLLEEAYRSNLETLRKSATCKVMQEVDLCIAFDSALMEVALSGGKLALPFEGGLMPGTDPIADAVELAWREMKQNEGFPKFLDRWPPWQGLKSRRIARLKAEREPPGDVNEEDVPLAIEVATST